MRPIIIFLAVSGVAIITWLVLARPQKGDAGPKVQAIAVSKHTDSFNSHIKQVLTNYAMLAEALVKWDSAGAKTAAVTMAANLQGFTLDELKNDSALIYETALGLADNVNGDLQTIQTETSIRPQREAFNNLTDNIKQFINTIKYDREKLYLQECTMAFDDDKTAYWLSTSKEDADRRNPYLGLHHPEYGKGMLKCGETKQTINHTGTQ